MKKTITMLLSLSLFLSGCTSKAPQVTNFTDTTPTTIKEFEKEVPSDYEFNGSMDALKEFFNSISANLALQVYIKDFKVDKDNFEAVLDDQLYKGTRLFGKLDKYGNIKSVNLVCEKAEERNEILRYNLLMQSITAVTTPEMNSQQRGEFTEELGMPKDDITLKDSSKVIEKDGHTYNFKIQGQKLVFNILI